MKVTSSRILLQPAPQLGLWTLSGSVVIYFSHIRFLRIPDAFWTDLASVPNWAWPLLDCTPNQLAVPGLVHDYAVRSDASLVVQGQRRPISFDDSLVLMSEVMEWAVISPEDRWKVVSALKVDPGKYWHQREVEWKPEAAG